jgi:hypothetical protein
MYKKKSSRVAIILFFLFKNKIYLVVDGGDE